MNSMIRNKIQIYIQLMRADKPIGTLLLLWPTLWALWLATDGVPPLPILASFILGTFFMRSAGCVVNDYADRNFDGAVQRTQNRPFAIGVVSGKEAAVLVIVLLLLAVLCLLPLNTLTWKMSIPAVFLAFSYPFTKRFFPIPQLYLGIAFSFGIPMAFAAVSNHIPVLAWVLFFANLFWTLAYDTAYAMADKEDDLKLGIRTSAITFGRYDAEAVLIAHLIFSFLMLLLGILISANGFYWLIWIVVVFLQYWQYQIIRQRNRVQCFQTFLSNNRVGLLWFVAIALQF